MVVSKPGLVKVAIILSHLATRDIVNEQSAKKPDFYVEDRIYEQLETVWVDVIRLLINFWVEALFFLYLKKAHVTYNQHFIEQQNDID